MNKFIIIFVLLISSIHPQQPTNLTALITGDGIQLEWEYIDSLVLNGFLIHKDIELPCSENQVQDCINQCIDISYLAWLGDGLCDDPFPVNYFCAQWSWDFGDCGILLNTLESNFIPIDNDFSFRNDFSVIGAAPDTSYLVYSAINGCFFVSGFIGESCWPPELEILESSNTVCVGDCPDAPDGDLNSDGMVNIMDLVRMVDIVLGFGILPTFPEWCTADLNQNSEIDIGDFLIAIDIILELGE